MIVLNGTTGLSGVDGSAGTPALQGNDSNTGISFGTDTVTINTGGVARVTTDASGNLGLGVTPSAWGSDWKALEGGNGASYSFFTPLSVSVINGNAYNAGATGWRYKTSSFASQFVVNNSGNGSFSWFTAPSGTAGNAISFTQAMTLTAGGNLGIGTASPQNRLTIQDTNAGAAVPGVRVINGDATNFHRIDIGYNSGSSTGYVPANAVYIDGFKGGGFGNLGGLAIGTSTDAPLVFGTNATERARIDSSGSLLVGETSTSAYFDGNLNVFKAGNIPFCAKTNAVAAFVGSFYNAATSGDNNFLIFLTETSPTARGSITYNRGAGVTAYNTTSDYRAKDINGSVSNALATIAQLKPYMGTMKGATIERPMFVAHETQAVAPYAVTGEKDAINDNGEPVYQQMDHSTLVPLLTAAIQEQQTLIQSLTSRLEALENK